MTTFNGERVTQRGGSGAGRGDNPHVTGTYQGSMTNGHLPNGNPVRSHFFSAESTGGGATDSHVVHDTEHHQWNPMSTDKGQSFRFRIGGGTGDISRA